MDKWLLKMILAIAKLFVKQDVDFERLKIITETKILMDRRRTPASYRNKQRKEPANPLLLTLAMYTLMGGLMALAIMAQLPMVVSLAIFHSYILFMMAMTLVTDFSSVLLDTTDNNIILPTPVSSRTLFAARIVHILVYLLQFTIALAILPVVATFITFGFVAGFITIILVFFTVAFAVFLTHLLYALILRFANEQKIRDIISYFQIFMTIFFVVGFQVLPRMINFNTIAATFQLHWYSYLAPPVWMAVATEAFNTGNFNQIHLLMIACAVVMPVIMMWVMIRYLAPSFSRKLAALNTNAEASVAYTNRSQQKDLSQRLSSSLCVSDAETVGFEKTWKITGRDKNFKMQFYPSLAYLFVFGFVFVFKSGKGFDELWQSLPDGKLFLWFVYLPMFSISTCLGIVGFYENFAAAWIYQSSPLLRPGEVISGMLKALMLKFFIPIYLLLFAGSLVIWGPSVIDDFILGFFNNALIFLLIANLSDHYLPFSRQANIKMQSGKLVRMIMQLAVIAVLIGLHYLAIKIVWLPAALIPVSAFAAYMLLKRIQQLSWLKISI